VLFASDVGVGGRSQGHGQQAGILVRCPLTRFEDLTSKDGVLLTHQNAVYHKNAIVALDNFQAAYVEHRELDIRSQLNEVRRCQVEENRAYLKPIMDTILTCTRQNIALREHRNETGSASADGVEPEHNDGNFRALLRYRIRGGDKDLESQANSARANATYQSADIQNALISVAGSLVKESVICRIKSAKFWSIIADETTDHQNREQLVVVVRYVQKGCKGKWFCFEDPVAVVEVYSLIKDAMPTAGSEVCLCGI